MRLQAFCVGLMCITQACDTTLPLGSTDGGALAKGSYVPGSSEVVNAASVVGQAYCARLFSDCQSECTPGWCGSTQQKCVEDWANTRASYMDYPMANLALAQTCAQQMSAAACATLPTNTLECQSYLVDGCPTDVDGYGAPYSIFTAAPLPMSPTSFKPMLCNNVEEFFEVALQAKDQLLIDWAKPDAGGFAKPPTVRLRLHRYEPVTGKLEEMASVSSLQFPTTVGPAIVDGAYYLEVELATTSGRNEAELVVNRQSQ